MSSIIKRMKKKAEINTTKLWISGEIVEKFDINSGLQFVEDVPNLNIK